MQIKKGQGVGVSVETGELTNGAVTALKLATDAVETLKIKALAVTTAKLAADLIDATKVADNAIQKEHLNAGSETALRFLQLNSGGTALQWGAAAVQASDNVTKDGKTETLGDWLLLG